VLGHGSLGVTYRAEDTLLQRAVAVKMLADRYADDSVFRERFMAATAAAGRLIHPNIVTVLDAGVVDGHPFVVMELVDGQSLRTRPTWTGPCGRRWSRSPASASPPPPSCGPRLAGATRSRRRCPRPPPRRSRRPGAPSRASGSGSVVAPTPAS